MLTLADEVLTSDSRRYWDAAAVPRAGPTAASFDKQIVRNWLPQLGQDRHPAAAPRRLVEQTARATATDRAAHRRGVTAMTDRLADATAMGAVTLDVADLDGMVRYYGEGVGLDVLDVTTGTVTLGRAGVASVVLPKRLFGFNGGRAAEEALIERDMGWPAIERATPPAGP